MMETFIAGLGFESIANRVTPLEELNSCLGLVSAGLNRHHGRQSGEQSSDAALGK